MGESLSCRTVIVFIALTSDFQIHLAITIHIVQPKPKASRRFSQNLSRRYKLRDCKSKRRWQISFCERTRKRISRTLHFDASLYRETSNHTRRRQKCPLCTISSSPRGYLWKVYQCIVLFLSDYDLWREFSPLYNLRSSSQRQSQYFQISNVGKTLPISKENFHSEYKAEYRDAITSSILEEVCIPSW